MALAIAAAVAPDAVTGGSRDGRAAQGGTTWMETSALFADTGRAPGSARGGAAGGVLFGVPRPPDWDGGALANLSGTRVGTRAAAAAETAAVEPVKEAVAPAALRAPAEAAAAPERAAREELPDALRSNVRGTCAAKGDFVSSDDERAGAFGGSYAAASNDAPRAEPAPAAPAGEERAPAAGRGDAGSSAAARSRTAKSAVALTELDAADRALVAQAGELLRTYLAASPEEPADARGVRAVRAKFAKMRKAMKGDAAIGASAGNVRRRRGVGVNRLVGILTQVVLAEPSGEQRTVYFPRGADVTSALEEVIRVLGAAVEQQAQTPSGAVPSGALPVE
jgi:hypothetical protein